MVADVLREESGGPRNRTSSYGFGDHHVAVTPVPRRGAAHCRARAAIPSDGDANMCSCHGRRRTTGRTPTCSGRISATGTSRAGRPARDRRARRAYPEIIEECRGAIDPHEPAAARRRPPAPRAQLRPRDVQLAGLVRGVPAARAGPQARAADRARGLAAARSSTSIPGSSCAACSTRTAAGPSTASRPSCRAGASPSTSIRAGSSRTCRRTSAGCSARRASRSACAGRSPTTATSRSRTGAAWRCWTTTSGRRR